MSTRPFPSDLTTIEVELHSKWGWFVALGVVLLVLGILALGNLLVATLASVFFVGIMMILGAVAQVIHAFRMKGWGGFFYWLLGGLLYGAAGVIAFIDPGAGGCGADSAPRGRADRLRHFAHLDRRPAAPGSRLGMGRGVRRRVPPWQASSSPWVGL